MRNLSLYADSVNRIPDHNGVAAAFDIDENVLFVASEASSPNGEVTIAIWKINQVGEPEDATPQLITSFNSIASASVSSPQVVSFKFIAETRRLVLTLLGGDITVIPPDEEQAYAEVEGTFDSGIYAASWSPDDSLIAIVTGDSKLILMTSTFDILSDAPLHTADFGEDAPINVGWGSKQTQFHGSLGKTAAQQPSATKVSTSSDDDMLPRISWRGDGSLFSVSSLSPPDSSGARRRLIRIYDRTAALQSTSETVAGLEHPLAWRPSGNLIAATQRFAFDGGGAGVEGRHDIVFFEKNGLQHGQFELRPKEFMTTPKGKDVSTREWGYRVRELSWSADSNVLCVWIERDEGDIVQLWTTSNYHWYLKQEVAAASISIDEPPRFTSVNWHPERPMHLILTTAGTIAQRIYAWEYYASSTQQPRDSGTVVVVDGSCMLLTPFRTQNVPPPMCSHSLSLLPHSSMSPGRPNYLRTPIHVSLCSSQDIIAILWEQGRIELWDLHTRLGPGPGKVMDPELLWEYHLADARGTRLRQINSLASESQGANEVLLRITLLGSSEDGRDILAVLDSKPRQQPQIRWVQLPKRQGRLCASKEVICWQACDGELYDIDTENAKAVAVSRFPDFCLSSNRTIINPNLCTYIGLGKSGKLHIVSGQVAHVMATNATSFVVTDGFCVFLTTAHEAVFAPLSCLASLAVNRDEEATKLIISAWEKRRIERGSRIVTAVPSTMSLVLQMPRGNLETVHPRPFVVKIIKQDLDMGHYRKALLACRKHRVDLNVLVEHNRSSFLKGLPSFVEQVDDVDHFNLFLTNLGRSSQPPEVIAELCDALRSELEAKDLTKYVNSILTAFIVKTPPDHEAGLALLLRLRETDPQLVEDAVKYIIFLVDAETLFNAALGMYDFSLVLMIAQHAQKDPREYLPFLRELRAMDQFYQRFKIDDHLNRHERAIENLSQAGEARFGEAIEYVERHQLYEKALPIWQGTDHYPSILDIYGDWLFEQRQFSEAALIFAEAGQPTKAISANEEALEWRQSFDVATREGLSEEEIVAMGYRIAERLSMKKRYDESARVLLDYCKDIREAVVILVQGNDFAEARRIITLHGVHEMLTEIVHPGALSSRTQIEEDITEMREQLQKQLNRLRELRLKKIEEPESFYGAEDEDLQNVDAITDVSMLGTAFTRYTAAPSAATKTSKRSSRSKRKMLLKVQSGRKGTVHEEEYLLKSVSKLVARFNQSQDETTALIPHLLQFTAEHRMEAKALQESLRSFRDELGQAINEIWQQSPEEQPATSDGPASVEESRIVASTTVHRPVVGELDQVLCLTSKIKS